MKRYIFNRAMPSVRFYSACEAEAEVVAVEFSSLSWKLYLAYYQKRHGSSVSTHRQEHSLYWLVFVVFSVRPYKLDADWLIGK